MKIKIPLFILGVILVLSILAPVIAPYNPLEIDMTNRLVGSSKYHLLGTDSLGRDTLSRVLYGGRQSIVLAFLATILAMVFGIIVGFFAGYYGGRVDSVITSVTNMFMGLPDISIMIAVVGIMGPSIKSLLVAITINSWTSFSRLVRIETMQIKGAYFVEGLKNIGAKDMYIFWKHILPNLSDTLIIVFVSKIGSVILNVTALSYLGLGLSPPYPDWAIMISDARTYFRSNAILVLAPGMCIVTFVWSLHSLGDGIRDKLDVRGVQNDRI